MLLNCGIFLNRIIIFVNFFCIVFDMEQEIFLDTTTKVHYLESQVANAFMIYLARNNGLYFPIIGYLYSFWPRKKVVAQSSNSFLFRIRTPDNDDELDAEIL